MVVNRLLERNESMLQPKKLLSKQKEYFRSGATRSIESRILALKRLKRGIKQNEAYIYEALKKDFAKPRTETYLSEIYTVYDEIDYAIRHLPQWMKDEKKSTPLFHFYAKSKLMYEPMGTVFIISPWNYPFGLAMSPLVGALAAGNTAILRPSEKTPETAKVMKAILDKVFATEEVKMILGDYDFIHEMIAAGVDYVLFTGGDSAARKIAATCAEHLIPYTLELGGKSPAIVLSDCHLKRTVSRLTWGKFLNAGQTCIAPDHVYVHCSIKDDFVEAMKSEIVRFYGELPLQNPDLASISNEKSWQRLDKALNDVSILHGGERMKEGLRFAPTLVDLANENHQLMQEEIFGPILPILSFEDLDELIAQQQHKDKPLALYLFTESKEAKEKVLKSLSYGGGCVNDCLIHYANSELPFGGVGLSGMGSYHGRYGFETFSHAKAITERSTIFDYSIRHAPYRSFKLLRKGLDLFDK